MATADWSIADTVAHVTAIALWDTALTQPSELPPPYPWNLFEDQVRITTVDTAQALNGQVLENELQIHGRDIARAVGARWATPSPYAAQFLSLFLAGIARQVVGRLLDTDEPPPRRRIAVRLLSRHMRPLTLVLFPGGSVALGEPDGAVDVQVRLEPAAFNVGGPRPWLLPAFLHFFRFSRGRSSWTNR